MSPSVNEPAPDFTLSDQNGAMHTLSDYRGKWVLVYFYPKDSTSGCTAEACGIRDAFPNFQNTDAVVLGISPDSVESHKKFAGEYNLPFPLLADTDKKVVHQYGAWRMKKMMGNEFMGVVRVSFLVNPDGMITKVYEEVNPEKHAEAVLSDLKALK